MNLSIVTRRQFSRLVFLALAGRIPIIIGAMHLFVHFNSLLGQEIEVYLKRAKFDPAITEPLWETWGMVSFMMGLCSAVMGLVNSSIFLNLKRHEFPPILPVVAMLLYYAGVLYVGTVYEQKFQFYGGLVGVFLLSLSLMLHHRSVFLNKVKQCN